MVVLIFWNSKPSLLLLNLTKELKLIFHHIKFMIFETVWSEKKNYSAIVPHPFLLQIYTGKEILIGFSYSLKPVVFKAISMSLLIFLCQKTYLGKFSWSEVVWNRSYQRKSNIQNVSRGTPVCYFLKTP